MALTVTTLGQNTSSGTGVCTLAGLTYAAGDDVVFGCIHDGTIIAGPPTVTDSVGNTFTPRGAAILTAGGVISRLYHSKITVGGTGITATMSVNTGDNTFLGARVQGAAAVSFDQQAQALDAAGPNFGDAVSITPASNGGVAISLISGGSNATNPATHSVSGGTKLNEIVTGGPNWAGAMGYNIYTTGAAQTLTWQELGGASTSIHMITLFDAGFILPSFGVKMLNLEQAAEWKTQRWDFPLGNDLLLDDFLPGGGGGGGGISYPYTATGGFTLGGAGTVARGRGWIPSGGLLFSGAATKARGRAWLPTGGLLLAGAATFAKGKAWTPSGGLVFGGTAPFGKGRTWTPAGGLVFSGAATRATGRGVVPSGGLQFSGAATVNRAVQITPAGGLTLSGTGGAARGKIMSVSGGLVFGGTAPFGKGRTWTPAGGLTLSGAATELRGKIVTPAGGLTLAGTGAAMRGKIATPAGGLVFSGAAVLAKGKAVTPSGGLTISGAATRTQQRFKTATGGLVFSGTAPMQGNSGGGGGGTPDERSRHWQIKSILPGGR